MEHILIVEEENAIQLGKKALLGLWKSLKEIHQVLKKAQEALSLSKWHCLLMVQATNNLSNWTTNCEVINLMMLKIIKIFNWDIRIPIERMRKWIKLNMTSLNSNLNTIMWNWRVVITQLTKVPTLKVLFLRGWEVVNHLKSLILWECKIIKDSNFLRIFPRDMSSVVT